ncbi:MAG: chloride channel protein [Acidobacteria bacterium]|nr:chloride channel protein [Acidobacteriota bacterium]
MFAVAFRSSLSLLYRTLYAADNVVAAITGLPWWGRLAMPLCGGTAAGLISWWRRAPGQGVSNVMEAVVLGNVRLSLRATISRVAASWTALAAGMSIGREGPLIEFGGSLGAAMGRVARTSLHQTRLLVAAGTAAGFAAAYNTPFAAVVFVVETIVGVAALEALLPTMAATVLATTVTRAIVGGGPIYGQRVFALESTAELVSYCALGIVAALAAIGFKRTLALCETVLERHPIPQPFRAALGGALVGFVALLLPEVAGNGFEPLNLILDGQLAPVIVAGLLLAKIAATSGSVASGVPGGIFTPVLLVGGGLGFLWAKAIDALGMLSPASPGTYTLVGMAATTAASIHAPLTAAVLVFELSGDYPIVLPLLVATVLATAVSSLLKDDSVYVAELRRKGLSLEVTLEGRRLVSNAG